MNAAHNGIRFLPAYFLRSPRHIRCIGRHQPGGRGRRFLRSLPFVNGERIGVRGSRLAKGATVGRTVYVHEDILNNRIFLWAGRTAYGAGTYRNFLSMGRGESCTE
jgi:hypothetical protein